MAAASRSLLIVALVGASLVGCSGGSETSAPVGEVMTSKQGADQIKKNGGKPLARNPGMVPSADD